EPHDPRVGEGDVDPPEGAEPLVCDLPDRSRVAHVGLPGHDTTPVTLHGLDDLLQIRLGGVRVIHRRDVLADVQSDDVRTLAGETFGMATALPPSYTSDEGDLPIEISHVVLLLTLTDIDGPARRLVKPPVWR